MTRRQKNPPDPCSAADEQETVCPADIQEEFLPPQKGGTVFELHHGDCVAGMQKLPDDSVDLVVTSPPYNLGIAYSTYEDTAGREQYIAWSRTWAAEVRRVLKNDGSFFLNVGAAPRNPLLPHEMILAFRDMFLLQNTIHWIKSITITTKEGAEISAGHFKPLQGSRYLNDCHEYLFQLSKTGRVELDRLAIGVEYSDKSNIARWGHTGGRDRRCRGNSWFVPYKTIQSRNAERPHPATFPVELAANCIKLQGERDSRVMLDPFLGIGNSAVAAAQCGVARFIGFEIDEEYWKEARRRLGLGAAASASGGARE